MARSELRWMLAIALTICLCSTQLTMSTRILPEETTFEHSGRSLLQSTCWPGMRVNCPSNTQVVCETGGGGGCSCLAMEACLPGVSACFIVVDGQPTESCGF